MYVKGKWKDPGGRKNNKIGSGMAIEVYPCKRFFTVTGNAFSAARVLNKDQGLLDVIYDRYFADSQGKEMSIHPGIEDLDVDPEYKKRFCLTKKQL